MIKTIKQLTFDAWRDRSAWPSMSQTISDEVGAHLLPKADEATRASYPDQLAREWRPEET